MSQSMSQNREMLLARARQLGIKGRHKMGVGRLHEAIRNVENIRLVTDNGGSNTTVSGGKIVTGKITVGPTFVHDVSGSLEQLRKAIQDVDVDRWPDGTVIRWEAVYNHGTYLYAALKCPIGWVTTARAASSVLSYEKLVETLAARTTHNVQVATTWEIVG
jgi:hypothetical protein